MQPAILISILGALSAIGVSIIGALFTNRNNIALQSRKLKEEHYIAYIEALHGIASDPAKEYVSKYVFARDKLFLIASEEVIKSMIAYENEGVGKDDLTHDKYLTKLIKSIRKDLKILDKDFPNVILRKS